uniref:Src kinase associated phosphoprotein 1 n=1 Tax=Strigamia maritima TaxID=126957 RepID=T1IYX9_STRMM
VESFCVCALQNENLSKSALTARDQLLEKLISFRKTLPQMTQKTNDSLSPEPVSPPPYLDMKGTNYVFSDTMESSYEVCENQLKGVDNEEPTYDIFENNTVSSSAAMTNATMKGFLEKKSRGLFNQYQKRWSVLNNGVLYYFAHISDSRQCGNIPLNGYEVRSMTNQTKDNKRDLGFELVCPGKRSYQFLAPTKQDLLKWITSIESEVAVTKFETPNSDTTFKSRLCENDQEIYETLEDETESKNLNISQQNAEISEVKLKPEEWYMGKWDCTADEPNELSFRSGQLVHITSKEYDNLNWWVGEIRGRIGLVPKNFLMEAYDIISE